MSSAIKIWVFDIDGTLTDGHYSVSDNGIITKSFYTRDFAAIERLLKGGYVVIFLSRSEDNCIQIKCTTNKFLHKYSSNLYIILGIDDKKKFIDDFRSPDFEGEEIAYIGDGENDLEIMKAAYFSACPCDAEKPILKIADYVSPFAGGRGAVADIIQYYLENKNGD